MKNKGFLPLTAVGLIVILLASAFVGYCQWDRHNSKMRSISSDASSSLNTSVATKQNDIRTLALESLHNALWRFGKELKKTENVENHERLIENIAEEKFNERMKYLCCKSGEAFPTIIIDEDNIASQFNLSRRKNGSVGAHIKLPSGTEILENLPDNSFLMRLSCEDLNISGNSRFYQLQDRMKNFGEKFGRIGRRWMFAEYAMAYVEAWWKGNIHLRENRSRALFQLALATHEIQNFGSTDYRAIIEDFLGFSLPLEKIIDGFNSEFTEKSIEREELQVVIDCIENCVEGVVESQTDLKTASRNIGRLEDFQPEEWFERRHEELSHLIERSENASPARLRQDFQAICEDFKRIYTFPDRSLAGTISKIQEAGDMVNYSQIQFEEGMNYIKKLGRENPLMEKLYEDMREGEEVPSIAEQVKSGVTNVLENLSFMESKAKDLKDSFQSSSEYTNVFPADFEKRLRKALRENNRKNAKGVLSEALNSAEQSFQDFEMDIHNSSQGLQSFTGLLSKEIKNQSEEPDANWEKTYTEYPGPGEGSKADPKEKVAEKYVIYPNEGTLAGLEKIFRKCKSDLRRLRDLNEKFENRRKKMEKFGINEELKEYLMKGSCPVTSKKVSREKSYELSPPKPLLPNPGISVYHDIQIENVAYSRYDPLGAVNESAPPTPIYLWFVDTVIYWAQWDVKIEIKEPIVEEIFDYRNQVIPRPILENSKRYVHKALPYKRKFRKSKFSFPLIVFSLRKFSISTN